MDAGDPYKDQMEECIYLIMQELKSRRVNNQHKLAYQVGCEILVVALLRDQVFWLLIVLRDSCMQLTLASLLVSR